MELSLSREVRKKSEEYGGADDSFYAFERNENQTYHSKPEGGHFLRSKYHNPKKKIRENSE
jgi:hypothetical protein